MCRNYRARWWLTRWEHGYILLASRRGRNPVEYAPNYARAAAQAALCLRPLHSDIKNERAAVGWKRLRFYAKKGKTSWGVSHVWQRAECVWNMPDPWFMAFLFDALNSLKIVYMLACALRLECRWCRCYDSVIKNDLINVCLPYYFLRQGKYCWCVIL